MPRKHPSDPTKITYRIKPPSVWRAIRAEWEAGENPIDLARRFDVSASSVQARRDREGWSREGMLARMIGAGSVGPFRLALPDVAGADARPAVVASPTALEPAAPVAPFAPAKPFSVGVEGVDGVLVNEIALRAALEALARGRAADAVALVNAGDVIGCFADAVALMRTEWAELAAERAVAAVEAAGEAERLAAAPPASLA